MERRVWAARWIAGLVVLAVSGCAPSLKGNWLASGHTNIADAFDLQLTFRSEKKGLAVYGTETGERAVPVCSIRLVDQRVAFVVDTRGNTTCQTLEAPLGFRGILGEDVIAGDIVNDAGQPVGQWRAFRDKRER